MPLRWSMLLSQSYYKVVTKSLRSCHEVITKLLRSHYEVVTKSLQTCQVVITEISQSHNEGIMKTLQRCHEVITKVSRSHHKGVPKSLRRCPEVITKVSRTLQTLLVSGDCFISLPAAIHSQLCPQLFYFVIVYCFESTHCLQTNNELN